MKMSAPLINAIVNNGLLHSNSRITQRVRLKSFTSCVFCVRLASQNFVVKCTEAKAVVASSLEVLRVCYIIALSDWRSK